MKKRTLFLFPVLLFALLLAAACAPVESPPADDPEIRVEDTPTNPPEPTEAPAGPYTQAWLEGLSPEAILLQQDFEPTFFRPESFYAFGRFPRFTLFADGSLVYIYEGETFESRQIEIVRLTGEEMLAMLERVMEMGFQNLEESLDQCFTEDDGSEVCMADASITVLRAVEPSGKLREVKTYAHFSNDPEAFNAITRFFTGYSNPAAAPYVPERATVFARLLTIDLEMPVQQWPLDIELLTELEPNEYGLDVFVLEGEGLAKFFEVFPVGVSNYFFEAEGQTVEAYIVPWPPSTDYSEQIKEAFP